MKKYVAYYRVSTVKQEKSGLGLEAQQAMVAGFVGSAPLLASYTETESGKVKDRPQLRAAIAAAKAAGATLVIAKLDRLSRNVLFIATLMETGVDFVATDMPDANRFTVHIFAALAEQEATMISQRTKAALAAKKGQGWKPGSPYNMTADVRAKGKAAREFNYENNPNNRQAAAIIHDKRKQGWTQWQCADHLNSLGYQTRRGAAFTQTQVARLEKFKFKETEKGA